MEDTSLMPFGMHKGTEMGEVPANYLLWLHENASQGVRKAFPNVFVYIVDCMDAIKKELWK